MVTEEILYHLTGNNQLSMTDLNEISVLVDKYPFFSPSQLLLALKLKKDNSYNYEPQLRKASLYFSNKVWLNYLLTQQEVSTPDLELDRVVPTLNQEDEPLQFDAIPSSTISTNDNFTNKEEVHLENSEINTGIFEEYKLQVESDVIKDVQTSFDYSSLFANTNSDIEVPTLEAVKEILANKPQNIDSDIPKLEIPLQDFNTIPNQHIYSFVTPSRIPTFSFISEEEQVETTPEKEEIEIEPTSSIYFSRPSSTFTFVDQVAEVENESKLIIAENESDVVEIDNHTDSSIATFPYNVFSDNLEKINPTNTVSTRDTFVKDLSKSEDEEQGGVDDTNYINNNISSIISNQLEGFNKVVDDNHKFDFENENKQYTIDYFASQGIKIEVTSLQKDKLTQQVRRFTDWLRQVNKKDLIQQDLGTDLELENAIQQIAKTSIEAKEIVTETMADVFIKQGKIDKAIQLYIKLSFLEPTKSTYFANKIQQFKGI